MRQILFLKNKTTPVDPYEEFFTKKGFQTAFVPLLEHTSVDREGTKDFLASDTFLDVDLFIVTSHRAVEMLRACLELLEPENRKKVLKKRAYTVGPATDKVLKKMGFTDVRGGADAGNGHRLADIVLQNEKAAANVVFFTGEVRKDIIPKKLLAHGIDLREKVIYKTVVRSDVVEVFERHMLDSDSYIVFFSPQGTEHIVEYVAQNRVRVAAIGPTTEEYLMGKSIRSVVARQPDAEALWRAIEGEREGGEDQ